MGDLTRVFQSKSFAKILLDCLSPTGHGIEIYHNYLTSFLMTENDSRYSALWGRKSLQEKIASQFYKTLSPSLEPLLFSFYSAPCLSRISRQTGLELIVYKALPASVAEESLVLPYLDCRALRESSDHQDQALQARVGFLFQAGKTSSNRRLAKAVCDLSPLDEAFNLQALEPFFSFASHRPNGVSSWKSRGVLGSVETCLRAEDPNFISSDSELPPQLDRHPGNLLRDSEQAESLLWQRWGKKVLLVTYTGHTLTKGERNSSSLEAKQISTAKLRALLPQPRHCKFVVLGCVRGPVDSSQTSRLAENESELKSVAQLGDLKNVPVVCFWGSGLTCLLSEPYAAFVRQSFFKTEGSGERVPNSKLRTFVPPSKARSDARRQQLADRRSEKSKRVDKIKKWCKCQTCAGCRDYDSNMSKAGPEKLVTTEFSLPQLLKMLGLWEGSESKRLLDRVCELSVASMDIESRTVELQLEPPGPGPNIFYGEIDSAGLESHPRYLQIPVMLAHLDGLSACGDSNSLFTVEDDTEASVARMMKKYLERLLEGQVQCSRAKAELLAPIFEQLSLYRKAYDDYCSEWRSRASEEFEREHEDLKKNTFGSSGSRVRPARGSKSTNPRRICSGEPEPKKRTLERSSDSQVAWDWDQFLTSSTVKAVGPSIRKTAAPAIVGSGSSARPGFCSTSFFGQKQQRNAAADFSNDSNNYNADDELTCQTRAESEVTGSPSWSSLSENDQDDDDDDDESCQEDCSASAANVSQTSLSGESQSLLYQAGLDALLKSRPVCLIDSQYLGRFLSRQQQQQQQHQQHHRRRQRSGETTRVKKKEKKIRDFFDLTARAWPHTIPGQLEKKLCRLVADYSVFSFYG